MGQGDKIKATIYLPDDVHRRLKIRAAEERRSMTDLVLRAVEQLLAGPVQMAPSGAREIWHPDPGRADG